MDGLPFAIDAAEGVGETDAAGEALAVGDAAEDDVTADDAGIGTERHDDRIDYLYRVEGKVGVDEAVDELPLSLPNAAAPDEDEIVGDETFELIPVLFDLRLVEPVSTRPQRNRKSPRRNASHS